MLVIEIERARKKDRYMIRPCRSLGIMVDAPLPPGHIDLGSSPTPTVLDHLDSFVIDLLV
jgi:hypothetical protein